MSSDGDPEQRIAELERPLSAGTPIEAPPADEPRRTVLRVGWIVLGLLFLGLIVGGIAIVSDRLAAGGRPVHWVATDRSGGFSVPPFGTLNLAEWTTAMNMMQQMRTRSSAAPAAATQPCASEPMSARR